MLLFLENAAAVLDDARARELADGTAAGGTVAADDRGHDVDRELGAAGEALTLLRRLTIDRTVVPVRGMPDRAIAPAASAQPDPLDAAVVALATSGLPS